MTMQLTKVAAVRGPGYPVGKPAPMYLNCPCGAQPEVDFPNGANVVCVCGRQFDPRGYMLQPFERHSVRVHFADGNTIETDINGTPDEIRAYYLGNEFNFGDTDECPGDNLQCAVKVEFLN